VVNVFIERLATAPIAARSAPSVPADRVERDRCTGRGDRVDQLLLEVGDSFEHVLGTQRAPLLDLRRAATMLTSGTDRRRRS